MKQWRSTTMMILINYVLSWKKLITKKLFKDISLMLHLPTCVSQESMLVNFMFQSLNLLHLHKNKTVHFKIIRLLLYSYFFKACKYMAKEEIVVLSNLRSFMRLNCRMIVIKFCSCSALFKSFSSWSSSSELVTKSGTWILC